MYSKRVKVSRTFEYAKLSPPAQQWVRRLLGFYDKYR